MLTTLKPFKVISCDVSMMHASATPVKVVLSSVSCLKEVFAMFRKPFQKQANREEVLSAGFKLKIIVWPGTQIAHGFIM